MASYAYSHVYTLVNFGILTHVYVCVYTCACTWICVYFHSHSSSHVSTYYFYTGVCLSPCERSHTWVCLYTCIKLTCDYTFARVYESGCGMTLWQTQDEGRKPAMTFYRLKKKKKKKYRKSCDHCLRVRRKSGCPICCAAIDCFCHCPAASLRGDGEGREGDDAHKLPRTQGDEGGWVACSNL